MQFRSATIDEVPLIAEIMTAVDPDEPWDPVLWRHRWEVWKLTGYPAKTYLGEREGRSLAVAEWWFKPPPPGQRRFGNVRVGTIEQDRDTFLECLRLLERDLLELGVDSFAFITREGEGFRGSALEAAGYAIERSMRWWELDLKANASRLEAIAATARGEMAAQDVAVTTLGEAEARLPDLLRDMYEVETAALQDVPTTVPLVSPPFEAWARELESPGRRRDRVWVAMEGARVLGMSWLTYPVLRGNVHTDWTCTAPAARGRGIARALKLETVLQAMTAGVERVRTANDGENAPILHLNQELGYRPIPGEQQWIKDA